VSQSPVLDIERKMPQPLTNFITMSDDIRMNLKPGMIVKVHQKITDVNAKGEEKQRIQLFEGTILAVKHGKESGATVTVRKISDGVGVEKIFPIHSPVVSKIELVRQMKVKQARPYFLRDYKKKLKQVRTEKGATNVEKVDNPVVANKVEAEKVEETAE
jgi:large subunit ribosomal protein L19